MKKIVKFVLVLLPFFTHAQGNLKASLEKVKGYVKEIKLEKSSINQQFTYADAAPFDIKIVITNTDAKGKSSEETYECNLALMGEIRRIASSKEMKVEINTLKNQKVIRYSKGEAMQGYENKLELLSTNIDDARELEKNIKEAIIAAKPVWESSIKLPKDDLGGLQNWLEQNVKSVISDKQTFKQSFRKSTTYKDRGSYFLEETDAKKTTESQLDFSWADLNDGSAELKISGKEIYVSAKAKNDYFRNLQNGVMKGYADELKFYANSPSEGSVLLMAIQKIIPLAKKELLVRLPKVTNKEDGFKIVKDKVKDFKINESSYALKMSPTCLTTYSVKSEVKGKEIAEDFKFNFEDLTDYKLSVSKDVMKISAKTISGKKYIQYTKDGNLQNFDNNIDFLVGDLEDARYLTEALPAISKGCKSNVTAGDFNWLVAALKKIENPKQELALQDGGDKCKWKFTSTVAESKKSIETLLELNLYDIDPKKIEVDVSGKTVGITASTLNKEKFIKQNKDNKSVFVNEFNFIINDIENASKALITIKNLVEGCKK
jgi:hypothetical protein